MRLYEILTEAVDVASSAFRRWFGDSKVVDASGAPLKLYRGLYGQHVASADRMEPREGYAMFFSTSPYVAASYSGPRDHDGDVGAIFPVYVRASNLKEFPIKQTEYGNEFDKFGFDRAAAILRPGEALVVRGVVDVGPKASQKADPKHLYSYSSDIYAVGRGTSVKSAVSNSGEFSDEDPGLSA